MEILVNQKRNYNGDYRYNTSATTTPPRDVQCPKTKGRQQTFYRLRVGLRFSGLRVWRGFELKTVEQQALVTRGFSSTVQGNGVKFKL